MKQTQITITVNDVLGPREAAKELGITQMTLWRWSQAGKIGSLRVGKTRIYPVSEITRLKKERA